MLISVFESKKGTIRFFRAKPSNKHCVISTPNGCAFIPVLNEGVVLSRPLDDGRTILLNASDVFKRATADRDGFSVDATTSVKKRKQ